MTDLVAASPSTLTRLRHFRRRLAGVRRPDLWLARRLGRVLDDRTYLALGHLFYFGRWPDYDRPRTVNEHIQAYMLRCRDPLLQMAADKAATRDWVARRIGAQYLVPLIGLWDDARDVPLETLPRPCVVKTTVGSGQVWFLRPDTPLDADDLRCALDRWLHTDFSRLSREWCYRGLRNRVIVEAMLGDGTALPADYKLYVIGGQVRFIQVDRGRFGHHTRNLYNADWRLLEERLSLPNHAPDPRPACLAEMLDITHRLAEPFEFLRVDCYVVGERLYVGELTNYPGAGFERFIPHRYAVELGALWTAGDAAPAPARNRAHAGRS
jgi:TupA-like ATPgrasp